MEAPAGNSWVAIGTGDKMDGSLMFLAYTSANKKGVTLSPRLCGSHVEPTWDSKIDCELVTGNGIMNGVIAYNNSEIYVVNAHCKNITGLAREKIDFGSTQQKFIFAVGPGDHTLESDDKGAGIRRHDEYGVFQMDMTKATVQDGDGVTVPTGKAATENSNAQIVGSPTQDNDWTGVLHATAMCGAFVIIFPMGVVMLRVLEKVMFHAGMQALGVLASIVGVAIGLYLSMMYNHSKHINSAHQILGLALLFFLFAQLSLGWFHHRLYKKTQRPTLMGKIHRYAGPVILALGVVNGFLGFSFADSSRSNISYALAVLAIGLVVVGLVFLKQRQKKRRAAALGGFGAGGSSEYAGHGGAPMIPGSGYATPYDPPRSDVVLGHLGAPPAYDDRFVTPRPMV